MISDASSFLLLPPIVALENDRISTNQARVGQRSPEVTAVPEVVGIPKTIDNDIPMLDCTFGRSLRSEAQKRTKANSWGESHSAGWWFGTFGIVP